MELLNYSHSALSLVAPILAILLAVITRKVILSLGGGILAGGLLIAGFNPLNSLHYIAQGFIGVFWSDGVNKSNVFIIMFLLLLGVITSLISLSGGTRAFGEWAGTWIKSRKSCQLVTVLLGFLIFIDDYFNSLAVGSVSRPLTDRYRISRAKLAYLIDSTAAPVCVIAPVSSWGAYIIALIGTILVAHNVSDVSAIQAFILMIPMNLYAVFALAMAVATAWLNLNVGAMRVHEDRALEGELYDVSKGPPPGVSSALAYCERGRASDLMVPVVSLFFATLVALLLTGAVEMSVQGKAFSILGAFELAEVSTSLFYGAIFGLLVTVLRMADYKLDGGLWYKAIVEGVRSMLPSVYILIFAWVLIGVITDVETGKYLASLVHGVVSPSYLPLIFFLVSGIMAFSTGTSWGAFGVMMPIAGDMAEVADISMLMPMLAAVLAGSVFGDHCSPISDTTIISSAGASCHHIDHVTTQLPYSFTIALVSICGYFFMGLTGSVVIGFIASLVVFLMVVLLFKRLSTV